MNSTIKTLAIAFAMGLSVSGAFAAATASDTAANYAVSGWSASTTVSEGSGFGAWSMTDNNANPPYAGTYLDLTSYGNADGVLSGGYAWGTYANGGSGNGFIDITAPFTAGPSGSSSLYNQTFSFALGSGGIGGTGSSLTAAIGSAFLLSYAGGGADNFTLSVDGGAANGLSTPVTFADLTAGLQIALTVSGALNSTTEGYVLTLSPFAGGPVYDTESGTFNSAAFNTSSFTLGDNNTSANGYFNNLNITAESVPEPVSMAMLGFAGLTTLLAIRRRK